MAKSTSKPRRRSKRQIENDRFNAVYAASLKEMREETRQNVQDVINESLFTYPAEPDAPCGRGVIKHKEALFDGILEALAETIVEQAEDVGTAEMFAETITDRLQRFVAGKSCIGRA